MARAKAKSKAKKAGQRPPSSPIQPAGSDSPPLGDRPPETEPTRGHSDDEDFPHGGGCVVRLIYNGPSVRTFKGCLVDLDDETGLATVELDDGREFERIPRSKHRGDAPAWEPMPETSGSENAPEGDDQVEDDDGDDDHGEDNTAGDS